MCYPNIVIHVLYSLAVVQSFKGAEEYTNEIWYSANTEVHGVKVILERKEETYFSITDKIMLGKRAAF